jgi:transposase-like protein
MLNVGLEVFKQVEEQTKMIRTINCPGCFSRRTKPCKLDETRWLCKSCNAVFNPEKQIKGGAIE